MFRGTPYIIFHPHVLVVFQDTTPRLYVSFNFPRLPLLKTKTLSPPPPPSICCQICWDSKVFQVDLIFQTENAVFGIYLFKSKRIPLNILQFTICNFPVPPFKDFFFGGNPVYAPTWQGLVKNQSGRPKDALGGACVRPELTATVKNFYIEAHFNM